MCTRVYLLRLLYEDAYMKAALYMLLENVP